jgi:hypothetical protein
MAVDLQAGGHRFDFITGLCMRCKMPLKKFEDSGRPQCTGRLPEMTIHQGLAECTVIMPSSAKLRRYAEGAWKLVKNSKAQT